MAKFKPEGTDETIAWITSLTIIVGIGIISILFSFHLYRKKDPNSNNFFSAKGTQSTFKTIWSFYSSNLGSWVLFGPPSFAKDAGFLGVFSYGISCGLPILILSFMGNRILNKYEKVSSLRDFVFFRFGSIPRIIISCVMILNSAMGLAAEYTAIGDLFQYIGLNKVVIMVIMVLVTLLYTTLGGLYVSILTDQIQSIFCLLLIFISAIYGSIVFSNKTFGTIPNELKPSYLGYNSLISMPICLVSSTMFSESFWQRASASSNPKKLKIAATISSILISATVLLFGMAGALLFWANPTAERDNNVILFELVFDSDNNKFTWFELLFVGLAVTMSESAIDSTQNALASNVVSSFLRKDQILWSRLATVIINLPVFFISLLNFNIMQLFLLSNLVTLVFLCPILIGTIDVFAPYITGFGAMFSSFVGFFSLWVYGFIKKGNLIDGFNSVFFGDYVWNVFAIAIFSSITGLLFWVLVEQLYEKRFNKKLLIKGFISESKADYIYSKEANETKE